jgi:hypothetical protein
MVSRLLMLAWANLANMMPARATAREHEFAIGIASTPKTMEIATPLVDEIRGTQMPAALP